MRVLRREYFRSSPEDPVMLIAMGFIVLLIDTLRSKPSFNERLT